MIRSNKRRIVLSLFYPPSLFLFLFFSPSIPFYICFITSVRFIETHRNTSLRYRHHRINHIIYSKQIVNYNIKDLIFSFLMMISYCYMYIYSIVSCGMNNKLMTMFGCCYIYKWWWLDRKFRRRRVAWKYENFKLSKKKRRNESKHIH